MQIAAEPIFEAILDIELTNGNDGRQKSWYKPAKERKFFESLLIAKGLRRKPFKGPVVVVVTRILGQGQRLWDSSSGLRGNYKELEDAMVACGWFEDDSSPWIKETRFKQDADHRALGPSVQIQIYDAEGK